MGIQNGSAPESGAIDWMTKFTMERDSLQVQLAESERLRTEAFQSCEAMRQELVALQAQLEAAKNEASKTGWVLVGSHLPNREQLDTEIVRLTNNLMREAEERKALQQQRDELQAQLEAAAVTPAICLQPADQIPGLPDGSMTDFGRVGGYTAEDLAFHESRTARHPDLPCHCGTAERLEAVRRMIGQIWGWYACIEYFDEIKWAEAWEQVGALLGHLQREAD